MGGIAMKRFAWILGILLLAAPAVAKELPEVLLGIDTSFDKGQIIFEVVSSGCTSKEDFRIERNDRTLTLYRLRSDDCKAMPGKSQIEFSLHELGLSPNEPFTLGNPFIVNEYLVF